MAQRTGLKVTPEPSFNVTVAGDDKLQSEGLCKVVHIKCQGVDSLTDFHILPIGACQTVLGVDWLQTLDEMTLSYKDQSVKISKGGKAWEFKGVHANKMELVTASVMDKVVLQSAKGWLYMYVIKKLSYQTL